MNRNDNLIEPHNDLLKKPANGTELYKIVSYKNFLDMIDNNYLYFNRVDTYKDDIKDSEIPHKDKEILKNIKFGKNNSALDYYNYCRSKTYACCFSIENSLYLWNKYGGSDPDKICLILDYNKLIDSINSNYSNKISFKGEIIKNIFDINNGLVIYGDLKNDILTKPNARLRNPIEYVYFKDKYYSDDNELRVSLSYFGPSENLGFNFPESIIVDFKIKKEIKIGTIKKIAIHSKHIKDISNELEKRNINVKFGDEI